MCALSTALTVAHAPLASLIWGCRHTTTSLRPGSGTLVYAPTDLLKIRLSLVGKLHAHAVIGQATIPLSELPFDEPIRIELPHPHSQNDQDVSGGPGDEAVKLVSVTIRIP